MRIAIPIWEDKLSPVLDTASRLMIVEEVDGSESSRFEIYMDEEDLSRRCVRIQGIGVDILICGAVSRPFLRMLRASGITIIPEIAGQVDDVLRAYFQGTLLHSGFLMPGCRRHGSQCQRDSKDGPGSRGVPCRFENRSKEPNKRR
jgi:predicted Fe-Mo cluster-binding NifX family protein